MAPDAIRVQVVFAQPEMATTVELDLPAGATVAAALDAAARRSQFFEVLWAGAVVGIYGRIVGQDQVLKTGDRVEIYRPLAADPKTARRRRVASKSGRS